MRSEDGWGGSSDLSLDETGGNATDGQATESKGRRMHPEVRRLFIGLATERWLD